MRTKFLVLIAVALASAVQAAGIDASFGTSGRVILESGGSAQANSAILQSDGKIVVVGATPALDQTTTVEVLDSARDMLVTRFNADGTLDSGFGTGGMARIDFNGTDDRGAAIAQQADGKLVVVGQTMSTRGDFDIAVVRLKSDGGLDASFNATGKLSVNVPFTQTLNVGGRLSTQFNQYGNDLASSLLVLPDGKLLIGGGADCPLTSASGSCAPLLVPTGNPGTPNLTLLRLMPDGTIDTSYGTTSTGNVNVQAVGRPNTMVLEPDGEVLITYDGLVEINSAGTSFARSQPAAVTGALIPTINIAAARQQNGGYFLGGFAVMAPPSGVSPPSFNLVPSVIRVDSTFNTDTSFGNGGGLLGSAGMFTGLTTSLLLEPSGKIVAAGSVARSADVNSPQDGFIVRLLPEGVVDTSFGANGVMVADFDEGARIYSFRTASLLRLADGKLVLVGTRGDLMTPISPSLGVFVADSLRVAMIRFSSAPQYSISQTAIRVSESSAVATIEITRSGVTGGAVSVEYSTANGTASAGTDFTSTSGLLTWQPGDADIKTITVPISNDNVHEPDKQFVVRLSNPSEGSLGNSSVTVTIADDDPEPSSGGGGGLDWVICVGLMIVSFARANSRRLRSLS